MSEYLDIAQQAAQEASKAIMDLAQSNTSYVLKNSHDVLAEGDLRSEHIIIEKIKTNFPNHAILSEEAGTHNQVSDYLWVVDPIDGTINFTRGIEEYCISIALCYKDEIIMAVIYQPSTSTLYSAEKGKGAFVNGQKLDVATEDKLINCIVATDNTSDLDARTQIFTLLLKISPSVRHVRIFGSCAMHLTRIASGQIDFYYKIGFNYWDFAAACLLLTEAGGKVTDMEGRPITKHSKTIVAASSAIYAQALQLLQ